MKRLFIALFCLALFLTACDTVPLTGRRQLTLLSDDQVNSMALVQYNQFLTSNKVEPASSSNTEKVKRVGNRLAASITQYLNDKGLGDRVSGYKWEFNLVESKEVNAWCMPGGKVVVYSGILPLCQDDAGLATVMAHEIGHAIARHGNERMSQQMVAQGIEQAGDIALNTNSQYVNIFNTAFGLGAQYGVILPHSRLQESEADHLGLIFMSMAGYDPHTSLYFWQRMAVASKNNESPFFSDHPSDQQRINDIQKLMPEAMKFYRH